MSEKVQTPDKDQHGTDNRDTTPTPPGNVKKRSPLWKRVLRWLAITAGSIAALLVVAMCVVAWYLTPERLTPLVEKYGSEYLTADVKAERVELTVWSSFPSVRLDITNLKITSRTLKGQPDSVMRALPADASRLIEAGKISGSINPWKLLAGTVALGDISVSEAGLNLISYSPGINNYDIVPASEEKKEEKPSSWKIRFGKIHLSASRGIHYFDAASSTDIYLTSPRLDIVPKSDDCELLETRLSTPISYSAGGAALFNTWPLELKGDIRLRLEPLSIELKDYSVALALFSAQVTAGFDMNNGQGRLNSCEIATAPIKASSLLEALPNDLLEGTPLAGKIDTDMAVSVRATAECPWQTDSPHLPEVNVEFDILPCSLSITDEKGNAVLSLHDIAMNGSFRYDGAKPAESALHIPACTLSGEGIELSLTLKAEELLGENPLFTLTSKGILDLKHAGAFLPGGSIIEGSIEADASIKARLNDITALNYENMEANGHMQLRQFLLNIPLDATKVYSRLAKFSFGNTFADADMGPAVAGAFRTRAEIDTLYCEVPGIDLSMQGAVLKAGASDAMLRQRKGNEIAPMGVSLTARRLSLNSPSDTMKVRARELEAKGSVTRYEGKSESPLLKAALSAAGMLYSDPTMRVGMRKFISEITAHLRTRNNKDKRTPYQRRYDRLAKIYPGLSADSIATLASRPAKADPNVVKPEVDNGVKDLFRQWGISGTLHSDRVGLTHLMYPARMSISNLDFDFSLDSVRLHRAHIHTQDNALTLSGTISNIRQLMLGRTRKPLKIRLSADIDSIDINQIAYNFTLGSALQSQRGYLARLSPEQEDAIVKAAAAIDTVASQASDSVSLLIPRNIDARFSLRADKALYTDINLYRLRSGLLINDGAASIDSLTASTDFGDAYLNLLYSSRNPELLNLALDLGFSNIDITKMLNTFPQITAMTPAISDLSGMVGAKLVGSFDIFPNMDIDFSSMNAMLNISGSDLKLQQSPLIRKIARLMLIRKNGPLTISDMDIQIAMHDNMIRLYPFKFGMEKYRFALLGENDMAQNMYYHLSVLNSPIPFKFGINVKGTFDNPKIRFGGAKYKENEAREMTNLIEGQRVNFVRAMRLELRKLINKATLSYTDRQALDNYGTDAKLKEQDDRDDSQQFDSPIEMLGKALNAPTLKALNKSKDAIKAMAEKAEQAKKASNKKKKGNKNK